METSCSNKNHAKKSLAGSPVFQGLPERRRGYLAPRAGKGKRFFLDIVKSSFIGDDLCEENMQELWIRLDDLPPQGREFTFPDQDFWTERFAAFDLGGEPGRLIEATALVMPQDKDAIIRGTLTGSIALACDRCAEKFEFELDVSFDEFESREVENEGEESRIREDKGVLMLDMGAVLWEQLMLTLPVKPTCAPECKGVCPGCGVNLNEGECTCVRDEGDARLAVFRDLKLK